MSIFFNVGSLILGVISWIIPVVSVVRNFREEKSKCCFLFSFIACAIALVLQILEINHRINVGDLSAVMDTISAITVLSVLLVIITFILNVMALYLCGNKEK